MARHALTVRRELDMEMVSNHFMSVRTFAILKVGMQQMCCGV
jgi:hypothetical protein